MSTEMADDIAEGEGVVLSDDSVAEKTTDEHRNMKNNNHDKKNPEDIRDLLSEDSTDDDWILELETALLSDCDINVIRKISTQRPTIPDKLRPEYWQTFLGTKGRVKVLDEFFDLPEQAQIRSDCVKFVDKLSNSEAEKLSIRSDIESILTNFSRLYGAPYNSDNGWIELLETLIHLNVKTDVLFKLFESIQLRFIVKFYNQNQNGENAKQCYAQPFHLLRLLLLYHDPELCNLFDTLKITPDQFSSRWFRSLFSSLCNHSVSLAILDNYITYSNPFIIFFLSLVMIINLREELISKKSSEEVISTMVTIPASLVADDIKDMFFIAEQHFMNKTPGSIRDFQGLFFQVSQQSDSSKADLQEIQDLSSFLCLPVSAHELLTSFDAGPSNNSYFVVDCRPPEQYNNGHFVTAFHLDCSLMLNDPQAFTTAVQALLASQKQAIEAKSIAGGEHLCFVGSGHIEEDCFVNMVISSFLQKRYRYVGILNGGFEALHCALSTRKDADKLLADHNRKQCLVCANAAAHAAAISKSQESANHKKEAKSESVFLQRFQNLLKPDVVKKKLVEIVSSSSSPGSSHKTVKHVSASDKLGKRYTGNKRFTLDEDFDTNDSLEEGSEFEILDDGVESSAREEIHFDTWKKDRDISGFYQCIYMQKKNNVPAVLTFSDTELFIFEESPNKPGYGYMLAQRSLELLMQITSKKKQPDLITFKYGTPEESVARDCLFLEQNQFGIIRQIKLNVVTLLDKKNNGFSSPTSSASPPPPSSSVGDDF